MNPNKSFTRPVTQISRQVSRVVMSEAGAEHVFNFMDEKSETDNGYVALCRLLRKNVY